MPWFGSYIFMLLLNHKDLHYAVNRICKLYKTTVLGNKKTAYYGLKFVKILLNLI